MTSAPRPQRRSDGESSHRAILDAAARLATVEGLSGLSLSRLAEHIGMSKSGLYAHFDSKEDLQLATVSAAAEVFTTEVLAPAMQVLEGLARLERLYEGFLSYVQRGVFPGGCFFASAAAEWDTRPGPVRERVAALSQGWIELIEAQVLHAQQDGALSPDTDPVQLAFEINALLDEANGRYLLHDDHAAFERARRGIHDRLEAHAAR